MAQHLAMTDSELLRRYDQQHDSRAFTELAQRHIDLVYATARRIVNGDTHTAEDVTQQVFVDLARKAPALLGHPCLAGWLHACTRFNAMNTVRRERRRVTREQGVEAMNQPSCPPDWGRIWPVIDDALGELDERDRHFVLLRFFRQESFATIAQQFQTTENTVQKAVGRALDALNASLNRRGITSTSAALSLVLSQATSAAPGTLLPTVLNAALAGAGWGAATALGVVKLGGAMVFAAGLAMGVGYWTGVQRQLAINVNEAAGQEQRHRAEIQQLQQRVIEEKRRTASAEAETSSLLVAIERARVEQQQRAVAAANRPPPTAVTQPSSQQYSLRPGDTAARIARRYGLKTAELASMNPGINWARLRAGQTIDLPPGAVLQPEQAPAPVPAPGPLPDLSAAAEYTVREGDSLADIMMAAHVGIDDIRRLNPGFELSSLSTGQKIRLR